MRKIDPTYGSDQHGLVWGYHFAPNHSAQLITSEAAVELLSAPDSGQFLWLHFSLSNASSEPWLRQNLTLPDAFYESLHTDVGSTRLEQEADSLVALIHDVLFDFTLGSG